MEYQNPIGIDGWNDDRWMAQIPSGFWGFGGSPVVNSLHTSPSVGVAEWISTLHASPLRSMTDDASSLQASRHLGTLFPLKPLNPQSSRVSNLLTTVLWTNGPDGWTSVSGVLPPLLPMTVPPTDEVEGLDLLSCVTKSDGDDGFRASRPSGLGFTSPLKPCMISPDLMVVGSSVTSQTDLIC
jgi:hypothetical protein